MYGVSCDQCRFEFCYIVSHKAHAHKDGCEMSQVTQRTVYILLFDIPSYIKYIQIFGNLFELSVSGVFGSYLVYTKYFFLETNREYFC